MNKDKICLECHLEFVPKSKLAKFCSKKCYIFRLKRRNTNNKSNIEIRHILYSGLIIAIVSMLSVLIIKSI